MLADLPHYIHIKNFYYQQAEMGQ